MGPLVYYCSSMNAERFLHFRAEYMRFDYLPAYQFLLVVVVGSYG